MARYDVKIMRRWLESELVHDVADGVFHLDEVAFSLATCAFLLLIFSLLVTSKEHDFPLRCLEFVASSITYRAVDC